MSFGFFNRRVLAAGLVMSLIFITVSTAYYANGAEPGRITPVPEERLNDEPEQRSRLHPKRMFAGLKRGVSKLFGRSKEADLPIEPSRPVSSVPSVSQQIDRRYAERGVRLPLQAPVPSQQLKQPQLVQRAPLPTKPAIVDAPKKPIIEHEFLKRPLVDMGTSLAAQVETEDKNPFADVEFSDTNTFTAKRALQKTARPSVQKTVTQASVEPQTAPEIKHLLGYCPVNLRAGKFQRGNPEFSHVYQGRTYTFDSQPALQEFRSNPEPYAPVLQGVDVIELNRTGRRYEGFLSFSCDYDGRFYLFRTAANQEAFLADPAAYTEIE